MRNPWLHRLCACGTATALMLSMHFVPSSAWAQGAEEEEVTIPEFSGRDPDDLPVLAPCSRFEESYDELGYRDKRMKEWPDAYHKSVSKVVTESLKGAKVQCGAEDYETLLQAGPELKELAKKLPPWKDTGVEVTRFDVSRVLLENLRIYECALAEFDKFLLYDTSQEKGREEEAEGETREDDEDEEPTEEDTGALAFFSFFFSDLITEASEMSETIRRERIIARRALDRTLTLIGTMDRLRPLQAELECMQGMSLDMRNIAALSAETSACMPRTWYLKDALRDYSEEDDQ